MRDKKGLCGSSLLMKDPKEESVWTTLQPCEAAMQYPGVTWCLLPAALVAISSVGHQQSFPQQRPGGHLSRGAFLQQGSAHLLSRPWRPFPQQAIGVHLLNMAAPASGGPCWSSPQGAAGIHFLSRVLSASSSAGPGGHFPTGASVYLKKTASISLAGPGGHLLSALAAISSAGQHPSPQGPLVAISPRCRWHPSQHSRAHFSRALAALSSAGPPARAPPQNALRGLMGDA